MWFATVRRLAASILACALAACAPPSQPELAGSAADPAAPVPLVEHAPAIPGRAVDATPVEPLPWGDVNRRVAPGPRGAAQ